MPSLAKTLRSLAFLLLLLSVTAAAQTVDAFAGFGTLLASQPSTAPAALSGDIAPSFGMDMMFTRRLGAGVSVTWPTNPGQLAGSAIRPVYYDVYALWKPFIRRYTNGRKTEIELQAGLGDQSIWSGPSSGMCGTPAGCTTFAPTNRLLVHLGAGWRVYMNRHVFVRDDVGVDFVHNNIEFGSTAIWHVGISLGYTF